MALPWPQVVLFGDSLFQQAAEVKDGFSFEAALQQQVLRRYDVVNRGLSGYNTSQALKHIDQIFTKPTEGGPKIKYLFVLLGANDACVKMPTNQQHIPLDKYKENLTKIITHPLITAHNPKILLVTPPPIDEIHITKLDLAWGHQEATRKAKISATYSQAVRDVAAEHPGTVLIDLCKAIMDVAIAKTPGFEPKTGVALGDPESGLRGYLEHLLPDGLHMSGEAYRIFFDAVKGHIESWDEESREGYTLPDWQVAPKLED
ncbi:hypothetical protein DL546_007138 [Coniochaeta pulveracea]|uniref:SGNH hydrolase-type esterase domain-containing protein n=1 Tax=Coniochaeta pulveracea TaxID=177199 RepID=A0A420Y8H9_9PEZI|nr:hypothetical protein DL546_007138 [Coniochaeta pulveracea]